MVIEVSERTVAIVGHLIAWLGIIGGWWWHCLQDRENLGKLKGRLDALERERK